MNRAWHFTLNVIAVILLILVLALDPEALDE